MGGILGHYSYRRNSFISADRRYSNDMGPLEIVTPDVSTMVEYDITVKYIVTNFTQRLHCATSGSCGWDLKAAESSTIMPNERRKIPTGIKLGIPSGYYGKIEARSSLAYKYGIIVLGGVIDSDYTNEIFVILHNTGDSVYKYDVGERIAQIIFMKHARCVTESTDKLIEQERIGGFGSTGVI